jgi:hypothetical protein
MRSSNSTESPRVLLLLLESPGIVLNGVLLALDTDLYSIPVMGDTSGDFFTGDDFLTGGDFLIVDGGLTIGNG